MIHELPETMCRTIAKASDGVGYCICQNDDGHDGEHRCLCGTTWTDMTAVPVGRW